jgi:hypothetical protein
MKLCGVVRKIWLVGEMKIASLKVIVCFLLGLGFCDFVENETVKFAAGFDCCQSRWDSRETSN